MPKTYFYHAYGLNINSSIKFPELMAGNANPDVIIHSNSDQSLFIGMVNEKGLDKIIFSNDDILYFFDQDPIFRVRYGKEIVVNPKTTVDLILLRHLILCQGLGIIFMQRGNLVLHGSSIKMKGKAVAFLGWCGEGKSTIAAAMNNRNYSTLTDDVLAIKFDEKNRPLAYPSFPQIKLCNDVCEVITIKSDSLNLIHSEMDKYSYNVSKNFSVEPLELNKIYILEKSDVNEITSLSHQEALLELIKNSYTINLFGTTERALNLKQCAAIVEKLQIKRLKRTQSLNNILKLTQMIEKDVNDAFC